MAILHKNISAEGDIHNPKWFSGANNGDVAWRNELGVLESTDELVLPAALDFVDGSAAPPTSNSGDIYVLSSGASVNAGWGTVSLGDWVRYDGTTWNVITPQKSSLCYNETTDALNSYDGSTWSAIGSGGGGGNTIYTADDSLTSNRVLTLGSKTLTIGSRSSNNASLFFTGTNNDSELNVWSFNYPFHQYKTNEADWWAGTTKQSILADDGDFMIHHRSATENAFIAKKTGEVILNSRGGQSPIGSADVSLYGETAIQGAGTSTGSALSIYDNDTTPNKLWDFLDNGNVNLGQATTFNFNNQPTTFDNITALDLNAKSAIAFQMRMSAGNNSISNGPRIEHYETSAYAYAKSLVFKARKTEGDIKHIAYSNSTHGFYLTSVYSAADDFRNNIPNSNRRFEIGDNLTFFQNTDLVFAPNVTTGTPSLIGSEDISLQGDTLLNANVNMPNLPTSATGLSSGDLWNDGGTLKIA